MIRALAPSDIQTLCRGPAIITEAWPPWAGQLGIAGNGKVADESNIRGSRRSTQLCMFVRCRFRVFTLASPFFGSRVGRSHETVF